MIKAHGKCGQTTLAYALSNSTLMAIQNGNNIRYELLDDRGSKINHYNNPTEYPHFRTISEDEILVDFVSF